MQHSIDPDAFGPVGPVMADAVSACVHCGFCLPSCPTYVVMGEEMDSPRGRIVLIKEVLEGGLELDVALPFLDNCLSCRGCETACPSGVPYGELITSFRGVMDAPRTREPVDQVQRALALHLLPHRGRFRVAATLGNRGRPLRRLLPGSLGAMLELLPARLPRRRRLPPLLRARGDRRARVAFLAGCVQEVVAPEINRAALRVLAHNGVEVVVPPRQSCCGALPLHSGAFEQARTLARRNLEAFPDDVDAIVTTAAGCGSGMHEYGLLFDGEPEHATAERFGSRVVDVSVFLQSLGLREEPPELAAPATAAYHDACHLAHAQRVRQEPRELLGRIAGLTLVEPPEPELCCGSAGTYNIERPEVARELGDRKAANLRSTGADLFVTGNIGCITQLRTRLGGLGDSTPVLHTIEVLDRAYARRPLT